MRQPCLMRQSRLTSNDTRAYFDRSKRSLRVGQRAYFGRSKTTLLMIFMICPHRHRLFGKNCNLGDAMSKTKISNNIL